jgi:hypothetical protein
VILHEDPISSLLATTPVNETTAVYYDGSIFVKGTPLNPGAIGSTNNPGLPIDWKPLGYVQGTVDTTSVSATNPVPTSPVGLYTFENIEAGNYILVLSSPGYVTRYAKVTVTEEGLLGHRELIGGDVNGDERVNERDASMLRARFSSWMDSSSQYNILYDINKDKSVNETDVTVVRFYYGFSFMRYKETLQWLLEYE